MKLYWTLGHFVLCLLQYILQSGSLLLHTARLPSISQLCLLFCHYPLHLPLLVLFHCYLARSPHWQTYQCLCCSQSITCCHLMIYPWILWNHNTGLHQSNKRQCSNMCLHTICCEYTDIFPFSHLFKSLLLFWYLFAYHYLDYIILETIRLLKPV